MRFLIKRSWYSEHFREYLKQNARYQILFGGRGSGKTHHIILKLIAISFLAEYNHIVYVNKVFRHIKKNQFADILKILKLLGLKKYFTINHTDYSLVNNITGTRFTALGMDDAENTKGISDATVIWWDETNRGTEEDFSLLNALLRTPMNPNHQFIISFNPISEKHWLRKMFFDENDAYQLKPEYAANGYLNHSTYLNNEFINQEDYLDTLTKSANGLQSKIDVDIKGKWGVILKSDLFIYKFNQKKHVAPIDEQPDRSRILYLSFDFNVNPMTCVVGQHDIHLRKIRFLKVYKMPDSGVYEICQSIQNDFPKFQYKVTGDAAGWSRNAASKGLNNNYEIIRRQLHLNWAQIVAPKANPLHTSSRTDCNAILENHKDLLFNPECEFLIEDLQTVQANDKGGILKVVGSSGHLLDAWRYYVNSFLGAFKKTI